MMTEASLLQAFEAGEIDPAAFSHRDHLRVGWAMLGQANLPFHQSYVRYRRGLVRLTRAAGVPQRYSETQTLGWLALIHEAVDSTGEQCDFDRFERASGLHGRSLVERYPAARLDSTAARTGLVLP